MTARALLNLEGAFALLWVAAAYWRSGIRKASHGWLDDPRLCWLLVLIPLPFLPFLTFPFLADDYVHILNANHFHPAQMPGLFTVPAGDHFFRPAGYLSYALDAHWAGASPLLWRLSNLALHTANSVLLYLLARRLGFRNAPALCAAILFGVHGTRPEAVTWVAARFDLLAVLFGLTSLLLLLYGRSTLATAALLAALLSKESAFTVPLLAAGLLFATGYSWRNAVRQSSPLFAVAAALFVYRWHLLGGVGGYRSAEGLPSVFQFKLISTLQALFPRFWATLVFPLNWSDPPGWLLGILLGAAVFALVWLASGPDRRLFLVGLFFAYTCALPVHQFLSIGTDLEKSRVVYFASAGFALLFASLITSPRLLLPAALVLLFQGAALEHNLVIWKRVGFAARDACQPNSQNLPNIVQGVYFLHKGYPECLEFK